MVRPLRFGVDDCLRHVLLSLYSFEKLQLDLSELVLALIVHSSVRRLVKVSNNLAGVLGPVFHLMLFVSSCVIDIVMSLLCFVIFTVRRDIHVVALLLHL